MALAAGCAVTPQPLTPEEIDRRATADRAALYANQDPISGPLSFPDVVARVMKYNLDFRLRMMEATLAQRRLDVSNWDMFPRLIANAGYVTRNNESGGRSVGIESGLETLTASSSVERNRSLASLTFSWSVLDFGVSYYRARGLADQALIAEERKRKVLQNLMQDTRTAYWRALGAQRLTQRMNDLMRRGNDALARARQIEEQGLLPQAQALAYQRALLDSTTLLQIRRQDLEVARAELAALMNLAPGTEFTLQDIAEPELPPMPPDIGKLEDVALRQRPELREEDYRKRITAYDTRRALLSVMPNLSFDAGWQYDSNRYLYNNSWFEAGLRVSADLIRLASIGDVRAAGDAALAVDDTRRLAQSMAVLTQVRVGALRYALARDELASTAESARVDRRLAEFARASASSRVDSELEQIRTEARAMLSDYQRQIAYANAQSAWGRLYNTLGLDLSAAQADVDLGRLSAVIGGSLADWHRRTFGIASGDGVRDQATAPRAQVRLLLAGVDSASESAVRAEIAGALRAQGIDVVGAADVAWSLMFTASRVEGAQPPAAISWKMALRDLVDGGSVGSEYVSVASGANDTERLVSSARDAVAASSEILAARLRYPVATPVAGIATTSVVP